jgi:hypothetical protein
MIVDVIVQVEITGPPPGGKLTKEELRLTCRHAVSDVVCRNEMINLLKEQGYELRVHGTVLPEWLKRREIPEFIHEGAD